MDTPPGANASRSDGMNDDEAGASKGNLPLGRLKKTASRAKNKSKSAPPPQSVASDTAPTTSGTPSWSLARTSWAKSGSSDKIPTAIIKTITSCLPKPISKTSGPKYIDLILKSGVIREVKMKGGLTCDPTLIGLHIDGVTQSSSVRLTFRPTKAP